MVARDGIEQKPAQKANKLLVMLVAQNGQDARYAALEYVWSTAGFNSLIAPDETMNRTQIQVLEPYSVKHDSVGVAVRAAQLEWHQEESTRW
jgi:hypothetical protein